MQLFLFTGEEQYLLHQEIEKRKNSFADKYSADAIHRFNTDDDLDQIATVIMNGGLFSTKSLIILDDIPPPTGNKQIADQFHEKIWPLIEAGQESHIIVFASPNPDKRSKLYKIIQKQATVKKFSPLQGQNLINYLEQQFSNRLTKKNIQDVIAYVGTNLSRLIKEITKIVQYSEATHTTITKHRIEEICISESESNAFAVLDALVTNPSQSIDRLERIKREGNDAYQTMGMMLWGVRNAILIVDMYQSGSTDAGTIAKTIKVPPFAVAKILKQGDAYAEAQNRMIALFETLIAIDAGMKTGRYTKITARPAIKHAIYSKLIP